MGNVRSRGWLVRLSCLLLASLPAMACSGGAPASSGADGALGARQEPLLPPSLDCGGTRWIAIKHVPALSCSNYAPSPDWTADPLFSASAGPLPDDLLRYCLFVWTGALPSPPGVEIANLQGNPDIENVVEDCPIIVPQNASSSLLQESLAREQRGWIHEAAGGLSSLPPPINTLRPTRLAVVDNAPENLGLTPGPATVNPLPPILPRTTAPPFGEHGEVLAYIGRDLGCPEGEGSSSSCAVHPETVLAMPDGNPSPPGNPGYAGGLFGKRSDLARAIQRTVDDWRGDVLSPDGAEARLVINLSLGWEDHSADSRSVSTTSCHVAHSDDLDSPSQAVHDAIVYARCHGALVVAASGNDTAGPDPLRHTGLMCPAHFMQWDAPTDTYCSKRILYKTPTFAADYQTKTGLLLRPSVTGRVYDPLVHPIGGVDFGDVPLVPHRPGSLPQLVAPGLLGASYENDFSSVEAAATPPLHAPYTLSGTSVPTVIAGAIAATAWAYSPDLAPANVMDLLHGSGVAPSGAASAVEAVRPQGVAPGSLFVRRASLCRTLLGMGLLPAGDCGGDGPRSGHDPQNPPMSQETMAIFTAYYAAANQDQVNVVPVALVTTPFGNLFTEAAALDVSPQPPWPTCPTCGLGPSNAAGQVILYLDPVQPLLSPFLVVDGVAYGSATGGALLLQTINATTAVKLIGLPPGSGAGSRAFLVWQDASNNSVHAQLPIIY